MAEIGQIKTKLMELLKQFNTGNDSGTNGTNIPSTEEIMAAVHQLGNSNVNIEDIDLDALKKLYGDTNNRELLNLIKEAERENTIKLSVQVKNKSMLSQAVYVELIDEKGNKYPPDNKDSIKMFRPLKFNKPITQSLVFSNISDKKIFYVGVYSKDIFKKNKKTLITKLSLKDAKKELQAKS